MTRPDYLDPDVWDRLLAQRPDDPSWPARVAEMNRPGRVRMAYCKEGRHNYGAMNGGRNGLLLGCPLH